MSNAAAQAYARTAQTTASPREIEAQALLKAANKLQDIVNNLGRTDDEFAAALLFNRKLWAILLSAVTSDDNLQPVEVRQNIVNIGTFVLTQTAELQLNPQRDKLKPLIDINCNLAAGLSGRA
ncbi:MULTISPECIES: flagellar biosynthesis regulator FlaF [unclassified Afipia]|uniref:flagellar biosynthesis regulator FlaF n=1 Tax=unclassified Afipia TaxID=2642050 RepID=UPI0004053A7B|nr:MULTISPECIES: flagellar biosynthesis regulator FlaF [unclassified Afipia]